MAIARGIVVGFMLRGVKWEQLLNALSERLSRCPGLLCSLCTTCLHSIKSSMKIQESLQVFVLLLQGILSQGCSKLSRDLFPLLAVFGWCNKWFDGLSNSEVLLGSFPEALTPAKRVKDSRQLLPAREGFEKSLVKDPVSFIAWESDNVPH